MVVDEIAEKVDISHHYYFVLITSVNHSGRFVGKNNDPMHADKCRLVATVPVHLLSITSQVCSDICYHDETGS